MLFPEDGKRAVKLFRRSMNTLRRKIALVYVLAVVGAGLVYCWGHGMRMVCYTFPTALLLVVVGYRWYARTILRESLAKRAKIAEMEDHWTFSATHVRRQVGPNHATFEWRYLESAVVADDMLVLLISSHAFYCIPLRFFSHAAEMATVADWARAAGVPMQDFRKGTR
ncbi:MAG: YcxB family protein [Luteolibacter sp.]